jgi:hypothetical protein
MGPPTYAVLPPCPERSGVNEILEDHLPAFALANADLSAAEPCSKVVTGDFNADGLMDYAAVLTERLVARKYSDGTPKFSSYVFVFLAARLPYAQYQAVLLMGHSSEPKRITLERVPGKSKGAPDRLVVKNASYSRTTYEWAPSGFVVSDHAAD